MIKNSLKQIRDLNLLGLVYVRLKFNRFPIIPYKNTLLKIHKTGQIEGAGKLSLGVQWESGRYMPSQLVMRSNSKITVHGYFRIYTGHSIWINEGASVIFGSGYINNNLNLSCFECIEFGRDVVISENVTIRDSDNHRIGDSKKTDPIKIGNKVWIGINATILKGVTIGDGAVIAAGAVVNRNVPPQTLVAGIPAVVKKTGISWN